LLGLYLRWAIWTFELLGSGISISEFLATIALIVNKQSEMYTDKIRRYGTGVKALKWNNYGSASQRYVELVHDIDFAEKSVLDVGCGTGNLLPYLLGKAQNISYTGVDALAVFIQEAQERYPDFNFLVQEYLSWETDKRFDVILCCGALNSSRMTIDERLACIKKMFDQSQHAVAFNMAGHHPIPLAKDQSISYVDSRKILDYCFTLSDRVILRHHYHPKDFTIVMIK
jgi:ubiquinone/menaquinone biosynthesis C-methylase UbiE